MMRSHKHRAYMLLAAAVLLVAFVSCGNLLLPEAEPPEQGGAAAGGDTGGIAVRIEFPGAAARTAMPDYASLSWDITASDQTGTVQAQGTYPSLTISLPHAGEWTFTARGTNGAGEEIFYGEQSETIQNGADNSVIIALGPGQAMQNGTGNIRLAIQTAGTTVQAVYYKLAPAGNSTGGGGTTNNSIAQITEKDGEGNWLFSQDGINAGTYLLYLYFTDSSGATVYVTAESVNVWSSMTADRWVKTGSTRYLTEDGRFILTQDIIDDFGASVGNVVYVSASGSDSQDGIGSVIAPAASVARAIQLLENNTGTVAVMGEVPTAETAITAGMDVVIQGADAGARLAAAGGSVFSITGGSLTLGAGITLTGDAAGESIVVIDGGAFAMQDGSAVTGSTHCTNGAVRVNGGTFTVSGSVQITGNTGGNVYLAAGQTITDGGLSAAARIGVSGIDAGGNGLIQITAAPVAGAADIFSADTAGYELLAPGGTAVYLFNTNMPQDPLREVWYTQGGTITTGSFEDAKKYANANSDTLITLTTNIDSSSTVFGTGYTGPIEFSGGNVTLDLNGHTIDRELGGYLSNGNVIAVRGSFTLTDSAGGGTITGGNAHSAGGVYVENGGTFIMEGGTITKNTAFYYGGGVCVESGGTFIMEGGTITENSSTTHGDGVYVNGGTFEMKAGIITASNTALGSGVYVGSVTFTMTGGTVDAAVFDLPRKEDASGPITQWPPA